MSPEGGLPGKGGANGTAQRHPLVDRVIEIVLVALLALSVALMLGGMALALAAGDVPHTLPSMAALPAALRGLEPGAYLALGLVVLMATPFIRVVGGMVVFVKERDPAFALVALAVLLIMVGSILLGRV